MVLEAGRIHWVHLYLYMAKHSTDSSLHRHLLPFRGWMLSTRDCLILQELFRTGLRNFQVKSERNIHP